MIKIDGSFGEGGGQVLRTSLGLSLFTGRPFNIGNIRARRRKPGLLRQHLTAVKAAAKISGAAVKGAEMGSRELEFSPKEVKHGQYRFAVGTAGSATLVLQTILPALLTCEGESEIRLEGGTHNPMAPPFDFLEKSFFGVLRRMGAEVEAEIESYGFYPAGGGAFKVRVKGVENLQPLELTDRGKVLDTTTRCLVSRVPIRIAEEEAKIVAGRLKLEPGQCVVKQIRSPGPGNVVLIEVKNENLTEVFTGFGEKGVPLKTVAIHTVERAQHYLENTWAADEHLADQLLIPMAIAGGGRFTTGEPSRHTETNMEAIKNFMDVKISKRRLDKTKYEITLT